MTVRLQDGIVDVDSDPTRPVLPSRFWREIQRVGFLPDAMEVWATGTFDAHSFGLDGGRWPLVHEVPKGAGPRRARFRIVDGGEDPPRVEILDQT